MCEKPNEVWEPRGYYCDRCGGKILPKKSTLLDKAVSLSKKTYNIDSIVDRVDLEELNDIVYAVLVGKVSLLSFGPAIGASKQGSYSAFTHAIKRLFINGYFNISTHK